MFFFCLQQKFVFVESTPKKWKGNKTHTHIVHMCNNNNKCKHKHVRNIFSILKKGEKERSERAREKGGLAKPKIWFQMLMHTEEKQCIWITNHRTLDKRLHKMSVCEYERAWKIQSKWYQGNGLKCIHVAHIVCYSFHMYDFLFRIVCRRKENQMLCNNRK